MITDDARLIVLRTTGFRQLKSDRIHARCPECGRKRSNGFRANYDPPRATLAETLCSKCCDKLHAFEPGTDYYDAAGLPLPEREIYATWDQL